MHLSATAHPDLFAGARNKACGKQPTRRQVRADRVAFTVASLPWLDLRLHFRSATVGQWMSNSANRLLFIVARFVAILLVERSLRRAGIRITVRRHGPWRFVIVGSTSTLYGTRPCDQ